MSLCCEYRAGGQPFSLVPGRNAGRHVVPVWRILGRVLLRDIAVLLSWWKRVHENFPSKKNSIKNQTDQNMLNVEITHTIDDALDANSENAEQSADRDQLGKICGAADHGHGIEYLGKKRRVSNGINIKHLRAL